jgi:hypothetical protein
MVQLLERTSFAPNETAECGGSGSYDPETLNLLRSVLDTAWASLAPAQQGCTTKSDVALRILRLARLGERDRNRLHMAAIIGAVAAQRSRRA